MPLDPSISLQAGQGVAALTNPMDSFSKVAGLANTLSQNRLIDASAQNAVDQNRNIKLQGDTSAQELGTKTHLAVAQIAATALSQYNPQDPQGTGPNLFHALMNGIDTGVQAGSVSPQMADYFKKNIIGSNDPAHLAEMVQNVKQQALQSLPANEALSRVYGQMGSQGTGAQEQPGIVSNPMFPRPFQPVGDPVTQQLAPGSQNALVDVPALGPDGKPETDASGNPTGRKETITGAEVARRGGNPQLVPGGFPASVTGRGPQPTAAPQQPSAQPQAPSPNTASAIPPRASGSFGTGGPTAAQTAAIPANAIAGAAQGADLIKQADNQPAQKSMLGEMESSLANFTSGKGQNESLNVQGWMQSLSPRTAAAFGIKPDTIASAELFKKLSFAILAQQNATLGVGTDAGRSTTASSNPGIDLSKMGNIQILHMMQGNADAISAKAEAWRNSSQYSSGDYAGFSTQFNKGFDQRVFQAKYYTPDERGRMMDGMSDQDRRQFIQKYKAA